MSAIGSGATKVGSGALSLGTSCTLFQYSPFPVVDPQGLVAPFCDSTGGWLPLICCMNGTQVLQEIVQAFGRDHDTLIQQAQQLPAGSEGLLFLPHLVGERVPDLPRARGCLIGIKPGQLRPGQLYRAALEGLALNLRWGLQHMQSLGLQLAAASVVGGGAANPLWCQILADVLEIPLQRRSEPESAALGAALQACWTVRRLADDSVDLAAVSERLVQSEGLPFEPDPAHGSLYRARFEEFTTAVGRLYPPA
jgi:sugar (pentulose or hexulose) kinase